MQPRHAAARTLAVAALLLAHAPAPAAITVTTTPAAGPTFTLTPVGSKTRVTLNTSISNQPTTFLIRGAATDQIENIVLNAAVSFQTAFVEIRGSSASSPIASVDSIDMMTSASTCTLLDCITTGNVGVIRMNTIADMNVGGDVTGSITLPPRAGGGESSLLNGTVTGRIRGDVIVDHGAIFGLTTTGGLGAPGAPIQLRTKSHLYRLTARDIYADINTLSNGGEGWTVNLATTNGPFAGSLTTAGVNWNGPSEPGFISINGDLDANVSMLYDVMNNNLGNPVVTIAGRVMPGRTFGIGRSLASGAQFRVGTPSGIQGQVIVNARNSAGLWAGSVSIAGAPLAPVPAYSSLSSTIGGGAVGLVPFRAHLADSTPIGGTFISTSAAPTPSAPIRLRHYGPVTWTGTQPLVIEAAPLSAPGAWIDQTSCFTIAREPGPAPHPNIIAAYPARPLPGGYTYRLRPSLAGPSALLCDLPLATQPPVADHPTHYTFTIALDCPGDADSNGVINFADISQVLSGWGGAQSCLAAADTNADGNINFADITTILAAFGNACP